MKHVVAAFVVVVCASGVFAQADKKEPPKPFQSAVVTLGEKAGKDWALVEAKKGVKIITDRDYKFTDLPDELAGGTLVQRNSEDAKGWLPADGVTASAEGSVYAVVRWKYLGKDVIDAGTFGKLADDGWAEVKGDAGTTFPDGEDWRWKVLKRPVKKGDFAFPLKTAAWNKQAVVFVFVAGK